VVEASVTLGTAAHPLGPASATSQVVPPAIEARRGAAATEQHPRRSGSLSGTCRNDPALETPPARIRGPIQMY